jgi:hypothetical protein
MSLSVFVEFIIYELRRTGRLVLHGDSLRNFSTFRVHMDID